MWPDGQTHRDTMTLWYHGVMTATTWRPPPDVYEDLRLEAFRTRRPMNGMITEAVREWLRARRKEQDEQDEQEGCTG